MIAYQGQSKASDIYAVFLFRDPPSPSFWIRPCKGPSVVFQGHSPCYRGGSCAICTGQAIIVVNN